MIEILTAYRREIEPAWSEGTGHPAYEARSGSSDGQCGVTSAWLRERLEADHGLHADFRCGYVVAYGEEHLGHCWLELDGVVIDLTGDQFGLPEVVCGAPEGVSYRGVPYLAPTRRLGLLKAALETVTS